MANIKITELDAATTLASTDVVPVVDVSEDVTKKITTTNLFRTLPDGTAAAPALAFSSDAANGVYLAGTDTVGISTGGTQRVTVDNNGNVNIKEFSPRTAAALTVGSTGFTSYFAATSTGTGNIPMIVERHSDNGIAIELKRNTTVVGNIAVTASNTAYNTSSDYRLKENIVDLDGAINRVKQLQPRRFNFIADAERTVDGFVAHEAAAVVPEAVTGTHNQVQVWGENDELPDGVSVGDNKLDEHGNTIPVYQGIDQAKLVPLLTAALQEAISEIETLKTKMAALEAA